MVDLKRACEDLRSLGRAEPTPDRRAVLTDHLLHNKWEGVQSCAAQVLAGWGGRESVGPLRAWLMGTYGKPSGRAIRGVAVRALARCVGAEDAGWVLDLYFAHAQGVTAKHELLPLVTALPVEAVRHRFYRESRGDDRDNRQAVFKAVTRMPLPDRSRWLRTFAADPDPAISKVARSWVEHDQRLGP